MSSMSNIAGLAKYITTFPDEKTIVLIIMIMSIITGIITFLINPFIELSFIDKILLGGGYFLVLLGISSIITGVVQQFAIEKFNEINMQLIHSLYLSLLSMIILSIIIIGTIVSLIFQINLSLNTLVFESVLIIGLNTLIIKSACQLNIKKSTFIGLI